MKKIYLIVLLILITKLSFSQAVDFDLIKYKGLNFKSSKDEIIEELGKPIKTFEPQYECGFLSEDDHGSKYFSLDYGKIKFTGNDKEGYLIDGVDFEMDNSIILNYGKFTLNGETKLRELVVIFGKQVLQHYGSSLNGGMTLFHKKSDDGIRLEIKEGKLIRFDYWSPC